MHSPSISHKVEQLLTQYATDDEPGIQYAVVNAKQTLFNQGIGLANIEQGIALTPSQTMAAFSMTKTLTAIAVLQLAENKAFNLTDKVIKYVAHPYDANISIQHLLNHTSGIANPIPLKWVHPADQHGDFDEHAELASILKQHPELDFQPGKDYQYSNIGYWLLGHLIEKVSGKRYTQYVADHIFQPLNLQPSDIGFTIMNPINHAKGYVKDWSFMGLFARFLVDSNLLADSENGWTHIKNVYLNGPSFGGVIGNAYAFTRILQDLLSQHSNLLSLNMKHQLYQQQSLNSGDKIEMTLGWHIGELNGTPYYYKEGGGAGFHSEMRIYPSSGLASVIMSNRTSFNSNKILSELDSQFLAQ